MALVLMSLLSVNRVFGHHLLTWSPSPRDDGRGCFTLNFTFTAANAAGITKLIFTYYNNISKCFANLLNQ